MRITTQTAVGCLEVPADGAGFQGCQAAGGLERGQEENRPQRKNGKGRPKYARPPTQRASGLGPFVRLICRVIAFIQPHHAPQVPDRSARLGPCAAR